jgi:hypothetical protein
MMEWLTGHGAGHTFEIHGDRVLVATERLDPGELTRLLETTRDWVARMPRVVFSLYAK